MLVLTRKIDEQIRIGDDVLVTVLRIMGDKVKIGIEAPRDVTILRPEVIARDACETNRANGSQPVAPEEVWSLESPRT